MLPSGANALVGRLAQIEVLSDKVRRGAIGPLRGRIGLLDGQLFTAMKKYDKPRRSRCGALSPVAWVIE